MTKSDFSEAGPMNEMVAMGVLAIRWQALNRTLEWGGANMCFTKMCIRDRLLREYLQAKGYSAELYPDGEAGYKAFLKNKYDLCVFDVMMPKKDGFTLAQDCLLYTSRCV